MQLQPDNPRPSVVHCLKQTWCFNRRSVVQSLLRTQHESHNGVPPGLVVTLNQDGGTPAQPDEGSSFHVVNWGRLLKIRKWSMWHNDVTRTTTVTTETWMQPKKQGQNGLRRAGRQKALLYTCSLHSKEVKDNTRFYSLVNVQLRPRCKGQGWLNFLTDLQSESWSIRSPHPNKVEEGNSTWRQHLHESSQGPSPSLEVFNLMHMLSVQRCFRVQCN